MTALHTKPLDHLVPLVDRGDKTIGDFGDTLVKPSARLLYQLQSHARSFKVYAYAPVVDGLVKQIDLPL